MTQKEMRKIGDILTPIFNRMTTIFYLLLRDHMNTGSINETVKASMTPKETSFSDELLRAKAESMASQVIDGEYRVTEIDAMWSVRGADDEGVMPKITPEVLAGLRSMMREMQTGKKPPVVDPNVMEAAARTTARQTPPPPDQRKEK